MLERAGKWISPGVRLRVADMIRLPLTSRGDRLGTLRYATKTVTIRGRVWPFAVWSPPSASDGSLPVILFLHGAGERGSDGHLQARVGLGPALCRFPERYPAHIVMPQCPVGLQWSGLPEEAALRALDETINANVADERRVYVTGVSMGGHGALRLAARDSSRFAAVVAICGWGNTNEMARRIKDVPLWLFHGAADPIVPARCSAELAASLASAGARHVRHTQYPGIGHECWDLAYADPQMPEWLFAQST
jgi:predicted peptidase